MRRLATLLALNAAFAAPIKKPLHALQTATGAELNRTEALIQWADKCAAIVPTPRIDMKKDCFNLAIGGAGSRTIFAKAQENGWKRAVHDHGHTAAEDLAGELGPVPARCFVVELREPAARLESWYKDTAGIPASEKKKKGLGDKDTIDQFFEKNVLAKDPEITDARSYPINWYFRNYSGVENNLAILSTLTTNGNTRSILYSQVQFYKEHGDELQVPGIDISSKVYIDENEVSLPLSDAPLIDCEAKQIVIGFLCAETLVPSFESFVANVQAGTSITPPAGLQVGVNPVLNASKYPEPQSSFMLSEKNRVIWNDAFNFDDMALYRHFCLGQVDDALIQQNQDAGGEGTAHQDVGLPGEE